MQKTTIDSKTAEVAHRELDKLIKKTGASGAKGSMTPLALARLRLLGEVKEREMFHTIERVFQEVAEERNESLSTTDPLSNDVFDAHRDLEDSLDYTQDAIEAHAEG